MQKRPKVGPRDRDGRGGAAIGIATRIEVSEMEANNALTKGILLPPISATVETDDSEGVAARKRVVGDIDRNPPPHRPETLVRPDDRSIIKI